MKCGNSPFRPPELVGRVELAAVAVERAGVAHGAAAARPRLRPDPLLHLHDVNRLLNITIILLQTCK